MMPRMKLKWAFGFAGVSSARSQPAVLGGRVFVGSESGDVFALDAKTGCTHWSYHAQAGIRTAVTVAPYKPANGPSGFAVFFADGTASAYAIDAATGKEIWTRKLDSHPYAKATGSVTVHDGRVYVPLAGVGEEGQGGTPRYECCTFRGSVTALNANTGAVIWKTYTVDELKSRGKNKEGVALWGPAGGGIWAAPTIDREAQGRVRRHRQRLRRSAASHHRRGARARHRHRQAAVVAAAAAQRRVGRRVPRERHQQPELPGGARSRLRLLGVADARENGRPARS